MTCLAGLAVSIHLFYLNNMNEIILINNIIMHEMTCFSHVYKIQLARSVCLNELVVTDGNEKSIASIYLYILFYLKDFIIIIKI